MKMIQARLYEPENLSKSGSKFIKQAMPLIIKQHDELWYYDFQYKIWQKINIKVCFHQQSIGILTKITNILKKVYLQNIYLNLK